MTNTKEPVRLRLNPAEKDSATWSRIERHIKERIGQLQRQLETLQPEAQTAFMRGQIAELRRLASAAEDELPPIVN